MIAEDFTEIVEQMNQAVAESIEGNIEAQAALVESWADAFEETIPEDEVFDGSIEGYTRAYEIWMDVSGEMFDQVMGIFEGEEIDLQEFRDIWLASANDAVSEILATTAFAAQNGQFVENSLNLQQNVNEVTEDSLAQVGVPTQGDLQEVGQRLVELERRQHSLERKLDRVIDALEDED